MAHLNIDDKTVIYILGGLVFGYLIYQNIGAIIGGVIGFLLSRTN